MPGAAFAYLTGAADAPEAGYAGDEGFGQRDQQIQIHPTANSGSSVRLTEDKKAKVAAHRDWTGAKWTHKTPGGESYEAIVQRYIKPTEGEKFSKQYSANFNATTGVLNTATTEGTASRVASPRFDQSAGAKTFRLPDPNPQGETIVTVKGTYHGVPGTYSCDPDGSNTCAVRVASKDFDLGGVTSATDAATFGAGNAEWTFKPADPMARVMSMSHLAYASCGRWTQKSADGKILAVSSLGDERAQGNYADVPGSTNIAALKGTAKH